jgi:glutamate---cysteine ligase / carboxylate-amine ligase
MDSYRLLEVFGIELEYMIVDKETLNVASVADKLIHSVTGQYCNDVKNASIDWSNELVTHVIELKNNHPVSTLVGSDQDFQTEIQRINKMLAAFNCQLLPGAVHPWMNPQKEARIWPHENNEIYKTYDDLFGCAKHGWANLQSMHINISFSTDEEFDRLHAAIRTILPLIPALSSSSPVIDGLISTHKSSRLVHYLKNQKKIPTIMGLGIPEMIRTKKEYKEKILQPMYRDIAPLDPNSILQEEWLNSRCAIPKFESGCVEIRLADLQECPAVDLSVAWFWIEVIKKISAGNWLDLDRLRNLKTEELRNLLDLTVRDAENATFKNTEYLDIFGFKKEIQSNDLLRSILDTLSFGPQDREFRARVGWILDHGSLSSRLLERIGRKPSRDSLREIYQDLSSCLNEGKNFE